MIKSDWKTAVCIFIIGLVSVLDIWGLLLAVEKEDRKYHDDQEKMNSYKGKDNRPKKVTKHDGNIWISYMKFKSFFGTKTMKEAFACK